MTVSLGVSISLVTFLVGVGIAWGDMRVQVNSMKETLRCIDRKLGRLDEKIDGMDNRLSRIEGRMNGG